MLDTESLNKCTEVDKSWNEFLTTLKLPWIRMIQNYVEPLELWQDFFRKANIEKLKVIAKTMPEHCDEFFPHNGTPLIFAAISGNVEIVSELLQIESNNKQPEDHNGRTPLHYTEVHFVIFLSGGFTTYGSNKFTGKETVKTHLCALCCK